MLARYHPSPRVHRWSGPYMTSETTGKIETDLRALYEDYTSGTIDRRAFMRRAVALGAAGAAAAALGPLASPAGAAALAQQTASASARIPLEADEWSYMWVNLKRAYTAPGAIVGGPPM